MEEDHRNGGVLDAVRASTEVYLMKCPVVVAKSWQSHTASSDFQRIAKVIESIDPLRPDDKKVLYFIPICC